ncbi:MAG: pantetheine-phosphate adenylyltransferase [Holdemania massiliensis]
MKRACYPGSFDPPTYGHLDIITRASSVFDELIIAIMKNPNKRNAFTEEERVRMLQEITRDLPNVKVVVGHGLTVEFAKSIGAQVLIRGIRAVMDYELSCSRPRPICFWMKRLKPYFCCAAAVFFPVLVRFQRNWLNNGDLTKFIPEAIINEVEEELNPQKKDRQRIPVGNKPTEKG